MRRAWKIALPVTCAALIGSAMAFELVHRHHEEQQKLAQDAQAYRTRAEQGDAEAQYALCSVYRTGRGVPQSYAEAYLWCRKAADQSYAKAQYGVGYLYYYGYGVDGDFAEALRWFHLAAEQKLPAAENHIGIAYEVGNGVTPDYSEAVRWYRLAADQGYAAAEYNLGWLYANGRGVGLDRAEARRWITRAADHGDRGAQQMLGRSWPKLGTGQKIQVFIPLIVGILFILPSRSSNPEVRSRIRRTTRLVGFGLLFSVAVSLFTFAYAGILEPPLLAGALGFARNLVGGAVVSILLQLVWRNSAKWSLLNAGVLFAVLNGIALTRGLNRLQTDSAIRLLLSVNGMPFGLAITSAVLLLRKKRGGETGGMSGSDEIAGMEGGEVAHS